MPILTYAENTQLQSFEVTPDQWLEIKAKYGKSLAQQIREQLEAEGMTVKQILAKNANPSLAMVHKPLNMLTEREAIRRRVERASELVRKELPENFAHDAENDVAVWFSENNGLGFRFRSEPQLGLITLQSAEQWLLLREVIGNEELKELIQKG